MTHNILFTGCTHFGDKKVIAKTSRPFIDTDEMDEVMIHNWNRVVGRKDHVYHLGDFTKSNDPAYVDGILLRLNGIKSLVLGNHDGSAVRSSPHWRSVDQYLDLRIPRGGDDYDQVVMFHFPIDSWHRISSGSYHVHAHTHSSSKAGRTAINRRVNVSVEAWNYTPVSLHEVTTIWDQLAHIYG